MRLPRTTDARDDPRPEQRFAPPLHNQMHTQKHDIRIHLPTKLVRGGGKQLVRPDERGFEEEGAGESFGYVFCVGAAPSAESIACEQAKVGSI